VLRILAELVAADTRRAALLEDGGRIVSNIKTLIGISEHLREHPLSICDSESLRAYRIYVLQILKEIIKEDPNIFSNEELTVLSSTVAGYRGGGRLMSRLDGDKNKFLDFVKRVYSDDGRGNGTFTVAGLIQCFNGFKDDTAKDWGRSFLLLDALCLFPSREELCHKRDEMAKILGEPGKLPLWKRDRQAISRARQKLFSSFFERWRFKIFKSELAFYFYYCDPLKAELATQERDAILVVIALEKYRRRFEGWPRNLEALTPEFLSEIPPDRYNGKPLRYRIVDGLPLLYSVGVDGDDDGGLLPKSKQENRDAAGENPSADGDWILWPPIVD